VAKTLGQSLVGKELGSLWHSPARLRKVADYGALKRLENSKIDEVSCYGKILFISANQKTAIVAQLGMTGQLKVEDIDAPLMKHTHLRWPLKHSSQEIRYVDPRRFGLIDACDEHSKKTIINRLGPDPFHMTIKDHLPLIHTMKKSSRAIKEILLDQSIVAGVGNIYASEALFLAGIDPSKSGQEISTNTYKKLVIAIVEVLNLAFKNSGTTFSNYVDGSGKKGDNLEFLQVFQRDGENCFACQTLIQRIKQGGRSTFYCPKCQK
jgi:formamidopyrimidine-DNA glycosylase